MDEFVINGGGPKIQDIRMIDGVPISYQQLTVSTVAVGLTIPSAATMAELVSETDVLRWRNDGVSPTSTVGMPFMPSQYMTVNNIDSLTNLKFIRDAAAANDVTLNIMYYKK